MVKRRVRAIVLVSAISCTFLAGLISAAVAGASSDIRVYPANSECPKCIFLYDPGNCTYTECVGYKVCYDENNGVIGGTYDLASRYFFADKPGPC